MNKLTREECDRLWDLISEEEIDANTPKLPDVTDPEEEWDNLERQIARLN